MRESCFDCARKHLAQAIIISHEVPHYAGDQVDDHFWIMIGHMAEAEAQIQKVAPNVADEIREARLEVMKSGPAAVYSLSLNRFVLMISELAELKQKPVSITGSESPRVEIDSVFA